MKNYRQDLKEYQNFREDLSVEVELVMKGQCPVIPQELPTFSDTRAHSPGSLRGSEMLLNSEHMESCSSRYGRVC